MSEERIKQHSNRNFRINNSAHPLTLVSNVQSKKFVTELEKTLVMQEIEVVSVYDEVLYFR